MALPRGIGCRLALGGGAAAVSAVYHQGCKTKGHRGQATYPRLIPSVSPVLR